MQNNETNLNVNHIRGFLALIGVLVGFVGMISIDAYYVQFGVQYSDLDLPFSHMVYRGFSVIMIYPYVLFPYFLAALWTSLLGRREPLPRFMRLIKPTYSSMIIIIFILGISSDYLGRHAGFKAATLAMTEATTPLPAIRQIAIKDDLLAERLLDAGALRLLVFSGEFAVFITTVDDPYTESPYTFYIRQDKINALEVY